MQVLAGGLVREPFWRDEFMNNPQLREYAFQALGEAAVREPAHELLEVLEATTLSDEQLEEAMGRAAAWLNLQEGPPSTAGDKGKGKGKEQGPRAVRTGARTPTLAETDEEVEV